MEQQRTILTNAGVGFADAAGAYHLCDASVSEDVACVDEAVQHLSCLLDQVTLVGIVLQLFVWRQKRTENIVLKKPFS